MPDLDPFQIWNFARTVETVCHLALWDGKAVVGKRERVNAGFNLQILNVLSGLLLNLVHPDSHSFKHG